jgi:hypothetical protein
MIFFSKHMNEHKSFHSQIKDTLVKFIQFIFEQKDNLKISSPDSDSTIVV